MTTARLYAFMFVLLAALAAPAPALAHSRAPTVALDFRLRISAATQALHGVRAQLIDGDRDLRLRVDPAVRLVVRGYLGEPFLRFTSTGVWLNRTSPTAAVDRIRARGLSHWVRLTPGHSFMWHDHRLAPPLNLRLGVYERWSIPITLDGRGAAIAGTMTRVARPALWPWLAGALAASVGLAALARSAREERGLVAAVLSGLAAVAALAGSAGFALGDSIARSGGWINAGCATLLAVAAVAALVSGRPAARAWTAAVVGGVAALIGLGSASVFWHGVVISSLPPTLTRLTIAVAVLGGLAAATLGLLADEPGTVRR